LALVDGHEWYGCMHLRCNMPALRHDMLMEARGITWHCVMRRWAWLWQTQVKGSRIVV